MKYMIISAPSLVAQAQMVPKKKAVARKSTAKPTEFTNLGRMVGDEMFKSG